MSTPDLTPLRMIWAALAGAVLLYAGLPVLVAASGEGGDALVLPLAGAAVAAGGGVFVARRALMGTIGLIAPPRVASGQRATPDELAAALRAALQRYQVGTIVGCALAEAVALFGLVVAMLGAPYGQAVPFFVAGFALIAVQFPRASVLESLLPDAARAAL